MSSQSSKQLVVCLIIFFTILFSLAITHSLSNSSSMAHSQMGENGGSVSGSASLSSIHDDEIYLIKDNRLVIGKNCLDFKGVSKKDILVDLYLLELDGEQPYMQKISRKKIGKQIRLGDYTYKMVAAKNGYLKLKMVSRPATP